MNGNAIGVGGVVAGTALGGYAVTQGVQVKRQLSGGVASAILTAQHRGMYLEDRLDDLSERTADQLDDLGSRLERSVAPLDPAGLRNPLRFAIGVAGTPLHAAAAMQSGIAAIEHGSRTLREGPALVSSEVAAGFGELRGTFARTATAVKWPLIRSGVAGALGIAVLGAGLGALAVTDLGSSSGS